MGRPPITIWLPLFSVLTVAVIAGGLGVIFIVLRATVGEDMAENWGHMWHDAPIIILGIIIVILVPLAAALAVSFDIQLSKLKLTKRPDAW
jgi:NADH:ubiquinone oxidoreductase subunit 6 (subunit J)